jgi:hypothetical protein
MSDNEYIVSSISVWAKAHLTFFQFFFKKMSDNLISNNMENKCNIK